MPCNNFDPVLHSPLRLAVISLLVSTYRAGITFLKKETADIPGSLKTGLINLKEAGYITENKNTCKITGTGITAFEKYVKKLEEYFEGQINTMD